MKVKIGDWVKNSRDTKINPVQIESIDDIRIWYRNGEDELVSWYIDDVILWKNELYDTKIKIDIKD